MLKVGDRVKVISKASKMHNGKYGRVTSLVNDKMSKVYFDETKKCSMFYNESLMKITL